MSPCSFRHGSLVAGFVVVLALPISYSWASGASDRRMSACQSQPCFQLSPPARGGMLAGSEWHVAMLQHEFRHELAPVLPRSRAQRRSSDCATAVSAIALIPRCTIPTPAPRARMAVRHDRTGEVMAVMDVPGAGEEPATPAVAEVLEVMDVMPKMTVQKPAAADGVRLQHVCRNAVEGKTIEANAAGDWGASAASPLVLDSERRVKLLRHLDSAVHHL